MTKKLGGDENKVSKGIKWFGMKMGVLFFCLSLLIGATMIVPIEMGFILESVASKIARNTNGNTGITAFYISIVGLLLPLFFYIRGLLTKSSSINSILIILFLSCMVFSNTALFYKDWLQPNFKMDGQQALALFVLPFKTSWIYLLIGYIHDVIKEN